MNATRGSKLDSMHRIADDRIEVLQFEVFTDSAMTGTPLKNLQLKKNILIAYIIRGNQLIYPGGEDTVCPGDRVIAVTFEHDFDEVDDLLIDEVRK